MYATRERTVSGRRLVVWGLVTAALVTAASMLFGPALREQVRQEQSPRTLREPIATGTYDGNTWEAVGRYDGTANCVELRYRSTVAGRACDVATAPRAATRLDSAGPTIAYGIAPETASETSVELDDGTVLSVPVRAGELGFPVGFWAVELPPGASLRD